MAIGFDGEFSRCALPNALYPIPIYFFAAVATAYAARQPEKSLAAFQLLLMIAFAIDVVMFALALSSLSNQSTRNTSIFIGYTSVFLATLWLAIAGIVAMARLFNRNIVPVITTIVLIVAPLTIGFRHEHLWAESREMQEAKYKAYSRNQITNEDNFYKQPTLLAEALDAITPQRAGVPELFFWFCGRRVSKCISQRGRCGYIINAGAI